MPTGGLVALHAPAVTPPAQRVRPDPDEPRRGPERKPRVVGVGWRGSRHADLRIPGLGTYARTTRSSKRLRVEAVDRVVPLRRDGCHGACLEREKPSDAGDVVALTADITRVSGPGARRQWIIELDDYPCIATRGTERRFVDPADFDDRVGATTVNGQRSRVRERRLDDCGSLLVSDPLECHGWNHQSGSDRGDGGGRGGTRVSRARWRDVTGARSENPQSSGRNRRPRQLSPRRSSACIAPSSAHRWTSETIPLRRLSRLIHSFGAWKLPVGFANPTISVFSPR